MMVFSMFMFLVISGLSSLFMMNYFSFTVFISLTIIFLFSKFFSYKMMLMDYFFFDSVSINLSMLSVWVILLMVFSSFKVKKNKDFFFEYLYMMLGLMAILLISFFVGDIFSFYFFFEASIIPTMIIIIGWGYQSERFQASIYFFFYTLVGSLPLLILILMISKISGGGHFFLEKSFLFTQTKSIFWFMSASSLMAFMIKMPMFFTHLWLPKAHVEAPVAGSMILAGVLLKLGGYGILRVFYLMELKLICLLKYVFFGVSLFGMMIVGFLCCRVNDFKALVAYSSVAHMAMVIMGLMTLSKWGLMGAFMMMIAHGISSSGLFCSVNIYYERTGSRSFYFNKGKIVLFPLMSFMIFMLCAANIAAPPTINLLSEIILMISIMKMDYIMLMFFPLGSFLGAVFTLFMYSYSQHGHVYYNVSGYFLLSVREVHLMMLHLIPLNYLFLNPTLFLEFNF